MNEQFRDISTQELKPGMVVWFEGKNFLDTSITYPYDGNGPLTGPYLIERVTHSQRMTHAHLVDPSTGKTRSMMHSWLKVPKENKNEH